jgi:hypothetical protein
MASGAVNIAGAEHLPLQSAQNTEFINNYYALSDEPLNLRAKGQEWFNAIYRHESRPDQSVGLVLGGTPWMGAMLATRLERTIMVDINPAMLRTAASDIGAAGDACGQRVEYVCANWLSLPDFNAPIDVVVGDGCMNFLKYPEGWCQFIDRVVTKLSSHAKLLIRFWAIPPTHKSETVDEIISGYMCRESIAYTEVRAHLLFAHWEPDIMAIRTERVVDIFDANETKFGPLFRRFPAPTNDLTTIRKFRNSGFVSYTPRLDDVLTLLSTTFKVTGVHFGPYGLAAYFPLIVAELQ